MAVTATNLIQGPANLWAGPFGTAEPAAIGTAPGAGWVDLGSTKEGVTLNIEQTFADLTVDQVIDVIARKRTGRIVTIATSLAEATLENLATAIGNTAPATKVLELDNGDSALAFSPTYGAIIMEGLGPNGVKRRFILRKTLQTGNIALAYTKDGQTVIPTSFSMHWVSSAIKPLKIEEA